LAAFARGCASVARAFSGARLLLDGDCCSAGCCANAAPASASEQPTNKLIIVFIWHLVVEYVRSDEALSWNFPATPDKRLLRGTDRTHILYRVTGCVWFPCGARIGSTKSPQPTRKRPVAHLRSHAKFRRRIHISCFSGVTRIRPI
jgi:hypothetical protein